MRTDPKSRAVCRELLDWNLRLGRWKHTLSVMVPESGHVANKLPRSTLAHELQLSEEDKTPLLYQLVHHAKENMSLGGHGGASVRPSQSVAHSSKVYSMALVATCLRVDCRCRGTPLATERLRRQMWVALWTLSPSRPAAARPVLESQTEEWMIHSMLDIDSTMTPPLRSHLRLDNKVFKVLVGWSP